MARKKEKTCKKKTVGTVYTYTSTRSTFMPQLSVAWSSIALSEVINGQLVINGLRFSGH